MVLLFRGALGVAPAPAAEAAPALPSFACVEKVRAARIARAEGKGAEARSTLEGAVGIPGCDLPALSALLELVRESGEASEGALLAARLGERIGDAATELPRGFLIQIARTGPGTAFADTNPQLLAMLERRLASAQASGRTLALEERVEIYTVIADTEQRLGHHEAERAAVAQILALAPTDALRWRALLFDLESGRWQSALDLIAPLLEAPEAPETLRYFRIRALAGLGRYDEVMREIERIAPPAPSAIPAAEAGRPPLELPPVDDFRISAFAGLLLDLAWTMRDLERDAEAAALFRRVLAYWPGSGEAAGALLHYYGTAEERAAAAAAAAARRSEETDPVALLEEGTDLLAAGDAAGARDLLARAAPQLGGSNFEEAAWNNLGSAAFKLERWDEAANAFGRVVELNPARVESQYKRGIALFQLKRWNEAIAALQRALALDPARNDARYYLAGCYDGLGDAAAAARERAAFAAAKP